MRAAPIVLSVVAGAMLYVGSASAQMVPQLAPAERRVPHPGAAVLAAAGNVVYTPFRVMFATVGGVLGGLTGWLTAGNVNAAHDIWRLPPFDGQTHLQPEMMYGEEPVMIGELEYRMHITPP